MGVYPTYIKAQMAGDHALITIEERTDDMW